MCKGGGHIADFISFFLNVHVIFKNRGGGSSEPPDPPPPPGSTTALPDSMLTLTASVAC